MGITPQPPEDDSTSVGRTSSREQHASTAPQIDIHQSRVFQTIPRSPRLQRPGNNTEGPFTGNLSESKDPLTANVADHQPSLANHGPTSQVVIARKAPVSQTAVFNRAPSDPPPFPIS